MDLLKQFQCHICHGTLQGAVVCPHCGAKGCAACFSTWLSNKQACPYCRGTLTVKSLVKLPWLDPIVIEAVRHGLENSEESVEEEPELAELVREKMMAEHCEQHKELVKVYCKQCECCLCVRCFFETHQRHECCPIDDVYRLEMKALERNLRRLKEQQTDFTRWMKEVETQVTLLDAAGKEATEQLDKHRDMCKAIIEKQREEKLRRLLGYHEQLTQHRATLEAILHRIETVARPQSKPLILRSRHQISSMIHEFLRQPVAPPPAISMEVVPAIPEQVTKVFVVRAFAEKIARYRTIVSDALNICGAQWILKLEKNPNPTVSGPYLSAFIEMIRGPEDGVIPEAACEFVWRMELVPPDGSERNRVVREATSRFCLHDSWGYDNMCSLEFVEDHFVSSDDGTLTCRFSIQPSSYYLLYRLSEWHCKSLTRTGSSVTHNHHQQQQQQQQQQQREQRQSLSCIHCLSHQ
ncbi:hypothetical protein PTSG_12627 [Salpingoeca rosetta]|uniref:RING-type domain-containing protein n=1 Tax=Salpingoeca rosetta (strain ATCC 50818 / BSB-021) TaxID=946362 RepID=F2UHK8_SALR5|nr:uncharacterized protein PTSG_12627 [Salpingoeca rosetta]EGD76607.1 hypothetical protein PTSG_12627 [Salpingoeca rosetta]|eukprot:XP_004991521.1 hypothetical protein PTSG_12627 [Salpingoeca rosetta]